jgi:hypothetical protein
MDEQGVDKLRRVVELLSEVLENRSERCVLASGGALDEAMLLGTAVAALNLASVLVRLVLASGGVELEGFDSFEDEVAGEGVRVTNDIKGAVGEQGDIWLVAACLARDRPALERIVERLRANRAEV